MTNLPVITSAPDENNTSLIALYLPDEETGKGVTEHTGFKVINGIKELLKEYQHTKDCMTNLYHAVMDNRHTEAWSFFCDAQDIGSRRIFLS
ncbi:hypothetical protein [Photorhabdus asymbiotica]|uniref:hypothetical protein n=1 Tax=Photorhabdus asymbiotica TaxID=291112 RepID=UPI003DA6DF9F